MGERELSYQEKDPDQAAIHFFHSGFPPGPLPLCFDELPALQQHHGAVGVGCDVLLDEIPRGNILNVFPGLFHCSERDGWGERDGQGWKTLTKRNFIKIPDGVLHKNIQVGDFWWQDSSHGNAPRAQGVSTTTLPGRNQPPPASDTNICMSPVF